MSDRPPQSQQQSNIPIPDPSVVTGQIIAQVKVELRQEITSAIATTREIATQQTNAARDIIETRLRGMDTTHKLLQDDLKFQADRLEVLLAEKLSAITIRIDSVTTQLRERDIRTEQDKITARTAVEAALSAQKELAAAMAHAGAEAIGKSESAVGKQIENLQSLIGTTKDATNTQIANLTGRLDRGEGGQAGAKENVRERQASIGMIVGIVGSLLGVLGFISALTLGVVSLVRSSPSSASAVDLSVAASGAKVDEILRSLQAHDTALDQRLQIIERGGK